MSGALTRSRLSVLVFAAALVGCGGGFPAPRSAAESAVARGEIELRAREIVQGARSDREKAIRVFEFVRDEVEYGFTGRFDAADPFFTLEVGRGHCNPQTELFVALLRSVGVEARQTFVTISPDILSGLLPKQAPKLRALSHSYAEVHIEGRWLRVDGYALDTALLVGAIERLRAANEEAGYGAHLESCNRWDGASDCMGQYVSADMKIEGGYEGSFEDPSEFYASDAYSQRMTGITRLLYRWFGRSSMNKKLNQIRHEGRRAEASSVVDRAGS